MGRLIEEYRVPLAITAGTLVGVGLLLLVLSIAGLPRRDASAPGGRGAGLDLQRSSVKLAAGVGVGLVLLVVTRWVVLAVAVGLVVVLWDQLIGGVQSERRAINRLDGLAAWTEALRDTIAGAVGLEQAIPATAVNASPTIRPALNLLVDRLRVREPLPSALLKFSDDLDDSSADLIVAALILNARLRGPGLRDVLGALSESAREELDLRRRVEGSRRSTRRSVQLVVVITLLVPSALVLFNQGYVEPYGTVEGQLVLSVVIAMFGLAILWLRRLAGVETPERFLVESRYQRAGEAHAEVTTG
ncbi:MAG TPA: type II secretion system F family protein [Nocardioidaceae bacterium]|nr:type II secretion system F family protein [Nocardioidaceae bacterium]